MGDRLDGDAYLGLVFVGAVLLGLVAALAFYLGWA